MKLKSFYRSLFLFVGLSLLLTRAWAQEAYAIFNKEGEKVSFQALMAATNDKSHVFFGEFHNNPIAHWLQVKMVKELFAIHEENLVVGAEMFESDNQLLINEYFADQIKEKSFEEEVRLWENYKTDYKPILEFAKDKNVKFIATNIPRRYANSVYYNGMGILQQLPEESRSYIAPLPIEIDTTLSSYKEIESMASDHNGTFMMEAQAVKDATMAHFILKNTKESTVFFHLNGAYHTNRYQGILSFLMPKIDKNKMLTIATVSQSSVLELKPENLDLADFVICVDQDMTLTH